MSESKKITLSRTLTLGVAGTAVMCVFAGAALVAAFVEQQQGGDAAQMYMDYASGWTQYIGWLLTGAVLGHAGRHFGKAMPSGTDP